MNNRNVERTAADSSFSMRLPIFDIVIWAIALGLLVLLVAVNGCGGMDSKAAACAKVTYSFPFFHAGEFSARGHACSQSWVTRWGYSSVGMGS